jgi:hypothetical protein
MTPFSVETRSEPQSPRVEPDPQRPVRRISLKITGQRADEDQEVARNRIAENGDIL